MAKTPDPKPGTALDEDLFPIVGWAGLSGEMIRSDTLRDMAQAGFTVNHNLPTRSDPDPVDMLDLAREAGMRMLLAHPAYHVTAGFKLTAKKRREIESVVNRMKDHPALYSYHLVDEPRYGSLKVLGKVAAFVRELDPYHPAYVNHFPPIGGFGARSVEDFYAGVFEMLDPAFLSYDHYCICVAGGEEIESSGGEPWFFPEAHIRIKPDFYAALDLARRLALSHGVPFWAFTNAVRHGYYPTPTEGHIRFQLMSALAYGALGLEYFTYAHAGAMVRPDGTTTETWDIARKVNRDIQVWAPLLRTLRSVGVYHAGPAWPMTQGPPGDVVVAEGDPVCIGHFVGADELTYLLVVSKDPCAWSLAHLRVAGAEAIYELDPRTAQWVHPYPHQPERQALTLGPGEGRLLRVGGEGKGQF